MCLCVQLYAKVAHLLASPVKMTHLWTGSCFLRTCVCVFVCTAVCEGGTSVSVSCQDDSSLDRQLCVCVCVCVCECEDGTSVIVSCRDNSSLDRQLFVMLCMCIFPFKTCYMKCVRVYYTCICNVICRY